MPDEPSNGELARRLDSIAESVHQLIGRPEYVEFQRSTDRRLADFAADLADFRRKHSADIRDVYTRIDADARAATQNRQSWRSIVFTGLIPAGIVVVSILVQIWLQGRGHR